MLSVRNPNATGMPLSIINIKSPKKNARLYAHSYSTGP